MRFSSRGPVALLVLLLAASFGGCGQEGTTKKSPLAGQPTAGAPDEEIPDEEIPDEENPEGGAGGDATGGTAAKGGGSGKGGAGGKGGASGKAGSAGKGGASGGSSGAGGSSGKGGASGSAAGKAGAAGKPMATMPLPLRIGNYNAENVFNDKLEAPSSSIEKENTPTTEAYHAKLVGTADALAQLAADIVVLQEIENELVLEDLRKEPAIAGKYAYQAIFKGNDLRGIDLGLVSSVPITKAVSHEKESFTNPFDTDVPPHKYFFARDVLEVHFEFNTRHVIVLGVHFKAKTGAPQEVLDKQIAEATQTRKIADALAKEDPTAAILILGDFNNSPSTQPLQIVVGAAPLLYTGAVANMGGDDAWTVNYSGKDIYDDQYANPLMFGFRDVATTTVLHLPAATRTSDHAPVAVTYQVK